MPTSSSRSTTRIWLSVKLLLLLGHKPQAIASLYAFRGLDAQQIRWRNFSRWKIDAKTGSARGPRCPSCRKRKPAYRRNKCRECYLASQRVGMRSGPDAPGWKGGRTLVPERVRQTAKYRSFRLKMLKRAGRQCAKCKIHERDGVKLELDHIQPIAARPDLIFDEGNVRILCELCHRRTSTWGSNAKAQKKQVFMRGKYGRSSRNNDEQ